MPALVMPSEQRQQEFRRHQWPHVNDDARTIVDSYAAHGGLASSDEILQSMRPTWQQPISVLARWIVKREVLSIQWSGCLMLPRFQFDIARISPHRGVTAAVAELVDVFDEHELADWFITPNSWLAYSSPAQVVLHDGHSVVQAARADRFVARGS